MARWFSGAIGMPRTRSVPDVGGTRQVTILIVVVLPAPFGPRKPRHSPGATAERDAVHRQPAPVPLRESDRLHDRAAIGRGL